MFQNGVIMDVTTADQAEDRQDTRCLRRLGLALGYQPISAKVVRWHA